MQRSEALVSTANAAAYLGQICKDMDAKRTTARGETAASIAVDQGRCQLIADDRVLTLRAEAKDAAALARVEETLTSHLDKVAQGGIPAVRWVRIVEVSA